MLCRVLEGQGFHKGFVGGEHCSLQGVRTFRAFVSGVLGVRGPAQGLRLAASVEVR